MDFFKKYRNSITNASIASGIKKPLGTLKAEIAGKLKPDTRTLLYLLSQTIEFKNQLESQIKDILKKV